MMTDGRNLLQIAQSDISDPLVENWEKAGSPTNIVEMANFENMK
jgi:hypothetical protein